MDANPQHCIPNQDPLWPSEGESLSCWTEKVQVLVARSIPFQTSAEQWHNAATTVKEDASSRDIPLDKHLGTKDNLLPFVLKAIEYMQGVGLRDHFPNRNCLHWRDAVSSACIAVCYEDIKDRPSLPDLKQKLGESIATNNANIAMYLSLEHTLLKDNDSVAEAWLEHRAPIVSDFPIATSTLSGSSQAKLKDILFGAMSSVGSAATLAVSDERKADVLRDKIDIFQAELKTLFFWNENSPTLGEDHLTRVHSIDAETSTRFIGSASTTNHEDLKLLVALLASDSDQVKIRAIDTITKFRQAGWTILPVLADALRNDSDVLAGNAALCIASLAHGVPTYQGRLDLVEQTDILTPPNGVHLIEAVRRELMNLSDQDRRKQEVIDLAMTALRPPVNAYKDAIVIING